MDPADNSGVILQADTLGDVAAKQPTGGTSSTHRLHAEEVTHPEAVEMERNDDKNSEKSNHKADIE